MYQVFRREEDHGHAKLGKLGRRISKQDVLPRHAMSESDRAGNRRYRIDPGT